MTAVDCGNHWYAPGFESSRRWNSREPGLKEFSESERARLGWVDFKARVYGWLQIGCGASILYESNIWHWVILPRANRTLASVGYASELGSPEE